MAPILFAKAISNNIPIKVFNNGNLERDFTYIDDIVEGIVRVIESTSSGNLQPETSNKQPAVPYSIYNIGNGNPVQLLDFIETMETALGKKAIKEFLPMQPGDVYKTFADVNALKNDFGYEPNTSIQKGIGEFVKWFKEYYQ
jgi:UDP-glucuronate 4-epimerase